MDDTPVPQDNEPTQEDLHRGVQHRWANQFIEDTLRIHHVGLEIRLGQGHKIAANTNRPFVAVQNNGPIIAWVSDFPLNTNKMKAAISKVVAQARVDKEIASSGYRM